MAIDCGNLHIRTAITDPSLTPNTITQQVVANGLQIGIIPQSTNTGLSPYTITVKNSTNQIIYQSASPESQIQAGAYMFFVIPFITIPYVGEIISIKLFSVGTACETTANYTVTDYAGGSTTSTTSSTTSTTINVSGSIQKYIHLQPTSSTGGYQANRTYYFKCSANNVTDDVCLLEFQSNKDPSKILDTLPTGGQIVTCPPALDWILLDVVCVSYSGSTTTTTQVPCATGLTLDNIQYQSNTTYKIYFTSSDVTSINWFLYTTSETLLKSGSSGTLTQPNFNADFGSLTNGTYRLKIKATNCSSNLVDGTRDFVVTAGTTTTSSTTTIPSSGSSSFTNYLKTVSVDSGSGIFSPEKFPSLGQLPLYTDPDVGRSVHKWAVTWLVDGANFNKTNRRVQQNGISTTFLMNPLFYNGIGTRCLDFIYDFNPDTGQPWVNNIDTQCGQTFYNFITRIPVHERGHGLFGETAGNWGSKTTSQMFDIGVEAVTARQLGLGDAIGGRSNVQYAVADIENGFENGNVNHLAFLLGMASSTFTYVCSQYGSPFPTLGYYGLDLYPNSSGSYPPYRLNIDGTQVLDEFNQPIPTVIPINPDWDPANKITISDKGVVNKGIIDFPNIRPGVEVSFLYPSSLRHGDTYDRTGSGDMVTVNKYGASYNTDHAIAKTIHLAEVAKRYMRDQFNDRKVELMAKIVCDKLNLGIFPEAGYTNTAHQNRFHKRRISFGLGLMTFLSGCEWSLWSPSINTDPTGVDGYNGVMGVLNLLHQRKDFSGVGKSAVDLKPNLYFNLWESQISYDSGSTWQGDKGTSYQLSSSLTPYRDAITPDGYWVMGAFRQDGIEPTTLDVRVFWSGSYHTHTITSNDWETVNPAYSATALSAIPDSDKDYYFNIIKLT